MAQAFSAPGQSVEKAAEIDIHYSLLKLKARLLTGEMVSAKDVRLEQASRRRKKLAKTAFIAVTGSSGKTTTTLLINHMLGHAFRTIVSAGANTMAIFTKVVLNVKSSDQFAIFEVSGHEPGAIDTACRLLQPGVGVITTVSSEHVSTFRNLENTAREKGRLAEIIAANGLVFLNADDPLVLAMREQAAARIITFGTREGCDYRATDIETTSSGRLRFQCRHGTERHEFEFGLLGRHFVCSALAGIAVAHQHGIDFPDLVARGRTFQGVPGRCSVHQDKDGTIYVCDTIKAPFATVALALDTVSAYSGAPRKTIVLGTISDTLKPQSTRYRLPVKKAIGLADRVILFGSAACRAKIDDGDRASGRVVRLENIDTLRNYLDADRVPGEVILLKGSFKADHLERIALHAQLPVGCWQGPCRKVSTCFDCEDIGRHTEASIWQKCLTFCRP